MAHIGRSVKNVEAPRPLKSQSRSSLKNNFMLIEELIQLIENVAISLQSGINNTEPMATLVQNLRIHGPQLESVSKDTLDRAFVVFRNASQDERLNIMTRLNLLELIELRAKGWEDSGINSYYKTKQATNAELNDVQNHVDPTQTAFLSTSPTFGGINMGGNAAAAAAAAIASVGSANQQHLLLSPGEVIRNSGKFPKPTKIPGKTYCKDEVVIRNADSGKVMGIKGRRVHMIEELSETIISFQRVNPGAKERLVQITGPAEDKINYAKHLIEDTIRRNASPVRLDPAMVSSHAGGGSCSSLASSNSDEPVQPRTPGASSNLSNRLSFNSAQNFMTAAAASQQMVQHQQQQQQQHMANMQAAMNTSTPVANAAVAAAAAGKTIRPHTQMLLHSYSTNDASLGEYKFTCNVGQHVIKITGDCCELVRIAKLVLDDHFSSAEFLASIEAGAAFDASPISTPTTPMTGAPQFAMGTPLHGASPLATDSGIGLNYISSVNSNNNQDNDDDVFFPDSNNLSKSASQSNGLARSRRSHFSRKDSTPEAAANAANAAIMRQKSEPGNNVNNTNTDTTRIVHQYDHLLYYAKSPHSWALPNEWQKICEKFPAIIRNKVTTTTSTTTTHASSTANCMTTNSNTTINNSTTSLTNPITNSPYSSNSSCSSSNNNNNPKAFSSLTLRVACNNAAAVAPLLSTCNQNMTTTNTTTTTTTTNIICTTTTNNNTSFVKSFNNNSNSSATATTTIFTHNIPTTITTTSSSNNVTNISPPSSSSIAYNNNLSISFNNPNNHINTNHNNNNNNINQVYYNDSHISNNTSKSLEAANNNNSLTYKLNSHHGNLALNIRRKGFFNRLTYSIDEDGYEAAANIKTPSSNIEPPAQPQPHPTNTTTTAPASATNTNTNIIHTHTNNNSLNVTAGSGRIHSAGLNHRHITSVRTGPMTSVPLTTNASTNTDTRQKLLNKQIKIISDIMVESSKCSSKSSNENLKSHYNDTTLSQRISSSSNQGEQVVAADPHYGVDDNDDEDDDVEIVAVSSAITGSNANADSQSNTSSSSYVRPKLNYEFRSYSTCD